MKLRASIFTVILIGSFAFAFSASAATRYAIPTALNVHIGDPDVCAQIDPCNIDDALDSTKTVDGDEVVLAPGDYATNSLRLIADAVNIHGAGLASQTRIVSTATGGWPFFMDNDGASVSDLQIETAAGISPLFVNHGSVQRVIVVNHGGDACGAGYGSISDSVCRSDGDNAAAFYMFWNGGIHTPHLTNVTAIATGADSYGLNLRAANGEHTTLTALDLIAHGSAADIKTFADTDTSSSFDVDLSYSNYATVDTAEGGTVTTPGTNNNQTAAPKFLDAAAGDFREAAGSPTIDAGSSSAFSGATDLAGLVRNLDGVADIGAFEYVKPPAVGGGGGNGNKPSAADTRSPILTIIKRPKSTTTSLKLKVVFASDEPGSAFMCKLDKAKFKKCKSPYKKTVKAGKHKLKIYAIDAAGNKSTTKDIGWLANKKQ